VIEGKDLIARDSSGTSDPYITITYNNVVVGKTEVVYKTLNPKWDERTSSFAFPVEGSDPEIQLEIFDKDKHGSTLFERTLLQQLICAQVIAWA
jgi:Ca2+-dependent lipid-binding protein